MNQEHIEELEHRCHRFNLLNDILNIENERLKHDVHFHKLVTAATMGKKEQDDEKYRVIIEHYGEPAQVLKAIEEMAELICDLLLGFDTYDKETIDDIDYMWSKIDTVRRFAQYHVNIEPCEFDKAVSKSVKFECADVENMLNQLRLMFGSWEDKRVEKLDRTMERIRK